MNDDSRLEFKCSALEQLLMRAAVDQELTEELVLHREAATARQGISLSASEQATLAAIPEAQLRGMIHNLAQVVEVGSGDSAPFSGLGGVRRDLPSPIRGVRPAHLLLGVAAVTTAALTAGSLCLVQGSRPDLPPESPVMRVDHVDHDATQGGPPEGGTAAAGEGVAADAGPRERNLDPPKKPQR